MKHYIVPIVCMFLYFNANILWAQSSVEQSLYNYSYPTDYTVAKIDTIYDKNDKSKIYSLIYYDQNNEQRKVILFYEDGAKKMEVNYKNNKVNGTSFIWSPTRELISMTISNESSGRTVEFYSNGRVRKVQEFDVQKGLTGYGAAWYDNGQLISEVFYDSIRYEKRAYYSNGNLSSKGPILFNKIKVGHWIEWYENGVKKSEGIYKDYNGNVEESVKTGDWQYWLSNGKLERKEFYDQNGNKKGNWKYYNEKGKLIKTERYN